MRRRILQSTLFVVAVTALVLGGPLAITTWQLVEDFTRGDLVSRLEQVAGRLDEPVSAAELDEAAVELAIPPGGRMTVVEPGRPVRVLGADVGPDPVVEELPFGPDGVITMAQPRSVMRAEQVQLTLVVLLLVVLSVAIGAVDEHAAPGEIHPHAPDLHRVRGEPAQQRPHPGQQLGEAERLADVVVGARVEADDEVHLVRAGGEHQHRQVGQLLAHPPAHLQPVHARQAEVEDQQVDLAAADPL